MTSDDHKKAHQQWLAEMMKKKLDELKTKYIPRPELELTLDLYRNKPN